MSISRKLDDKLRIPNSLVFVDNNEVLGSGSTGKVYKGLYEGKEVAVKKYELLRDSKQDKLLNEIYFTTNIIKNAPGLMNAFGYTLEGSRYSLVMEHMQCGDLFTCISDYEAPSLNIRYKMMLSLAKGIEYLHNNNVMHRDVKSPNVFLTEKLEAKLGDFDLAVESNADEKYRDGAGTYQWMAPELILGEPFTPAADNYSAGMVFWEIMAWKEPYAGFRQYKIFGFVAGGENEKLPDDCPPKVSSLIQHTWLREINERAKASELVTAMEGILADELLRETPSPRRV